MNLITDVVATAKQRQRRKSLNADGLCLTCVCLGPTPDSTRQQDRIKEHLSRRQRL